MLLSGFISSVNSRRLFLIDGIGALVSGSMLGLVLPHFEALIGVPAKTLHVLAAIAYVFGLYSFSCFVLKPSRWRLYMRAIALANLAYCCLTAVMVLGLGSGVKQLGVLYFVGEILVVVTLAYVELKKANFY